VHTPDFVEARESISLGTVGYDKMGLFVSVANLHRYLTSANGAVANMEKRSQHTMGVFSHVTLVDRSGKSYKR